MARPIKSTKVQRFFKYMGLMAVGLGIMTLHLNVNPPEKFRKRQYREVVETSKMIFENRGINPHAFGEVKTDGPFSPQRERK